MNLRQPIDWFLIKCIFSPLLNLYEHFIMYRIKEAWSIVHLSKIKNKGKNIKLIGYSRFLNPENIRLGNNIRIGYGCLFFAKGGIVIEDDSILSRNVTIYSSNHNYKSDVIPYDDKYVDKPVKIGKGVWIGMNVNITPGVTIGNGAIIGMGTTVSKDVREGAIVVGAEQREISRREMEKFYSNLESGNIFSVLYPKL